MKPTFAGRAAEAAVAEHLKKQGFKIITQNWRTPRCEIDLVALKNGVVYFVEVKFRGSLSQGGGFDYVTDKKLKQMDFAARVWIQENDWTGDWRLMAAAVTGADHENIEMVEV